MAPKNSKKKTTKAAPKLKAVKLNDMQRTLAGQLVEAKETGISATGWSSEGRFPTRSLQALEQSGLAKSKQKKNDEGVKETYWFPTAKTSKVLTKAANA